MKKVALAMATKPKKGFTAKSQVKCEATKKAARNRENESIKAIASRPMLGGATSDIRDTDYWACKPKELTNV